MKRDLTEILLQRIDLNPSACIQRKQNNFTVRSKQTYPVMDYLPFSFHNKIHFLSGFHLVEE